MSRLSACGRWMGRHPLLTGFGALALVSSALTAVPREAVHTSGGNTVEKPPAAEVDHTVPQPVADLVLERFVSPKLKDPSSAQYRDATYRQRFGFPVICGEVNARNSFGGYTGFQHFMLVGEILGLEGGGGAKFRKNWHTYCVQTDHDDAAHRKAARHGA